MYDLSLFQSFQYSCMFVVCVCATPKDGWGGVNPNPNSGSGVGLAPTNSCVTIVLRGQTANSPFRQCQKENNLDRVVAGFWLLVVGCLLSLFVGVVVCCFVVCCLWFVVFRCPYIYTVNRCPLPCRTKTRLRPGWSAFKCNRMPGLPVLPNSPTLLEKQLSSHAYARVDFAEFLGF